MISELTFWDHIDFTDLIFSSVQVLCYSSAGTPYYRTLRFGMPRIPPKVLNTVFYLYKDRADAETGRNKGGTGFLVAIPTEVPGLDFTYFVTNWHVALKNGCSVVRLNRLNGEPDIYDYDPTDWQFSTKYDIAVISTPKISRTTHEITAIEDRSFLTREYKEHDKIGPGDDVFMVGLFVDHQGANRNVPAVRFGNISMDPAPIRQENSKWADSYCIDMHSRSGYSGSPVFVYRTPGQDLEKGLDSESAVELLTSRTNHLSLLGIHWGQFPEIWEVTDGGNLKHESSGEGHEPLITDGRFIKGLSGMTCVLPAWTILEVLNMPELKKGRDIANARLKAEWGDTPEAEGANTESNTPTEGDALLAKMLNTPKAKD